MERKSRPVLAAALVALSGCGTSVMQICIAQCAILGYTSAPMVVFRFLAAAPLARWLGSRTLGAKRLRSEMSKQRKLQRTRSAALCVVTWTLVFGTRNLGNVSIANAYMLAWPSMLLLLGQRHRGARRIPWSGWLSIALSAAGIHVLRTSIAAGTTQGPSPVLGAMQVLCCALALAYMIEVGNTLGDRGVHPIASWCWTNTVGFWTSLPIAVVIGFSYLIEEPVAGVPDFSVYGFAMLVSVMMCAAGPQLGYVSAAKWGNVADLAPAGLLQVIPAMGYQYVMDGYRWPPADQQYGVALMMVAAFFGFQASKRMRAAKR